MRKQRVVLSYIKAQLLLDGCNGKKTLQSYKQMGKGYLEYMFVVRVRVRVNRINCA